MAWEASRKHSAEDAPSFETVPLGLKTLQWHGGDDDADDSTVI